MIWPLTIVGKVSRISVFSESIFACAAAAVCGLRVWARRWRGDSGN